MKDGTAYTHLLKEAEKEDATLANEKKLLMQEMEVLMEKMATIDQRRMVIATTIGYIQSKTGSRSKKVTNAHKSSSVKPPDASTKTSLKTQIASFFESHSGIFAPNEVAQALKAKKRMGSIRTGINALYKSGYLGRVHDKGTSYKYGLVEWLAGSGMDYFTSQSA